jgi:hypothetical protein
MELEVGKLTSTVVVGDFQAQQLVSLYLLVRHRMVL